MLQAVLLKIDAAQAESLEILVNLLKFHSIGTDPAFKDACIDCASWLKKYLASFSGVVTEHETEGQPVVIARWQQERTDLPHLLFYGHYDVQPVDPLSLWHSPPFELRVGTNMRGAPCLFGRGTSDDKGQLLTFLEAVRHWLAVVGSLPFRLTVLLEGDEEGNSDVIDHFLKAQGRALSADMAVICDTEMWDERTPAITTSLRGCIAEDVTVTAPSIDLHSGYFGGPARNPIKALSAMIAAIHDRKGRVTIPGFYDGVKPVSAARQKAWKKLDFSEREFLGEVGLRKRAGEEAFSLAEQLWARPTAEVNGIWGGYTGPGRKTVLPSQAHAKFTFRLVEGQKPASVRAVFRRFMREKLPLDCKISFYNHGGDSTGIVVDEENPWIAKAAKALVDEWGRPTALVGSGVSIPVVESFRKHQKTESLLLGFSRSDDAAHSPNEKYDLDSYQRGNALLGALLRRN